MGPNQVGTIDLYRDLSLPQQDVDLIVRPENCGAGILQGHGQRYLGAMSQVADEKNVAVTGVPV